MSVFSMAGSNPALPTYPLQRSVRLRSSASAYFNRTFTTPTNQAKWTWSGWVKRGQLGILQRLLSSGTTASDTTTTTVYFTSSDTLAFSGGTTNFRISNQVFRDPSAWYHIVIAVDTTLTEASKILIYVNGVQITFATTNAITTCAFNSAQTAYIGQFTSSQYFDGYMTEMNFIDGQALTPSSFGAYNSYGVWSPAKYTGTYGTNGFYLNFQDNSALTTTANIGIGKDSSGNGNYWTSNNISITAGTTYDSMLDVPTLTSATNANFAVMNPLNLPRGGTMSNGNLLWTSPTAEAQAVGTMYVSSGKWYWEMVENTAGGCGFGIAKDTTNINSATLNTGAYLYYSNGNKVDAAVSSAYGATFTNGDVIGIALDLDAGTLTFYKNNVSQGVAFTGLSGNFTALIYDGTSGSTPTFTANFGQRPFSYTPPTGFNRLCTYNLPDSIVPVGAQYMAATTYTGNGVATPNALVVTNTVNGKSFQPDFVWVKSRSLAQGHVLEDSVRGTSVFLQTDTTAADQATGGGDISSFNSNGFTLSYGNARTNQNAATYVGWQWRASNASAVTNTSGSVTSQVSANQTAGFSIVTFTCPASGNFTVGHGLGVVPSMFILKTRNGVDGWYVYHKNLTTPASNYLVLNTTAATATSTGIWGNTNPTSSVLTLGTNSGIGANLNGLLYCFAAVPGYSAFGSYTGNGSTDGPFVYTGFRPRWVMVKSTGVNGWVILDTSRSTYNLALAQLIPNLSNAEDTTNDYFRCDILSNGFKLRTTGTPSNANGVSFIYAAFAENPFKNALAR